MIIVQHLSHDHLQASKPERWLLYGLFTAAVGLFLLLNWLGIFTTIFGIDTAILLTLIGGYNIYYKAISALFEKRITADLAIVLAIGAALAIGEYVAAAEAVFIMLIGEGLEEFASGRTRAELRGALARARARANAPSALPPEVSAAHREQLEVRAAAETVSRVCGSDPQKLERLIHARRGAP